MGFQYLSAIIIKISRNKGLKNLYNIWVSLSEMSDKNIDIFHDIFFLMYLCVYIYIYISQSLLVNNHPKHHWILQKKKKKKMHHSYNVAVTGKTFSSKYDVRMLIILHCDVLPWQDLKAIKDLCIYPN